MLDTKLKFLTDLMSGVTTHKLLDRDQLHIKAVEKKMDPEMQNSNYTILAQTEM